jgi:hypothetical protein
MSVNAIKKAIAARLLNLPATPQGAVGKDALFAELKAEGHTATDLEAALFEMRGDGLVDTKERVEHSPPSGSLLSEIPDGVFLTPWPKAEPTEYRYWVVWALPPLQDWWKRLASTLALIEEGDPSLVNKKKLVNKRKVAEEELPATADAAQKKPNWDTWGLGRETDQRWFLFRKVNGEWRQQKLVTGIAKGRQTNLLKALAEGGGYLEKTKALKLERETYAAADKDKLMGKIKPEISRLREVIRAAIGVPPIKADPLPYDGKRQGWQSAIQIGYAVQEDREHQGGEQRLRFKTHEELTCDERADR